MRYLGAKLKSLAAIAACCAVAADGLATDLGLPVDEPLTGRWVSTNSSHHGTLEARLTPVDDGRYELLFKVTGSPIFNPEGRPYPDEGVYPIRLERSGEDGLSFTYRQPFPRIRALFFIPRRLTYRVRLDGTVKVDAPDRWRATVSDHNLALSFWVRPGAIVGTYDYDGRWEKAKGTFRLTTDRRRVRGTASKTDRSGAVEER